MSVSQIDTALLGRMFLAGAKNLEKNKDLINELNVFPVPDGDTGTNMTMTIMSAARDVAGLGDSADMKTLCKAISSGSLRGARGNSGVILSQLLRGFTRRIKEESVLTIPVITEAFAKAVETACKAVMVPKEGTILTVARGISEKARDLNEDGCMDLEVFLTECLKQGELTLEQTPEMLPVLKQAGVVDSGGKGLVMALAGAIDLFLGKEVDLTISDTPTEAPQEEEEPVYANLYCVALSVALEKPFRLKQELDLRAYLESFGERVKVNSTEETLTIHTDTNDPGMVLQKALTYGELYNVSVKNQKVEKVEHEKDEEETFTQKAPAPEPEGPVKPVGFIAVSVGDGLAEIFRSLGVDYVIEGGQTMNPSTEDILNAISKVRAQTVFVLPNNKNIILAANQAAELTTDKTVLVIPTKTIPQGITAAINFVPDNTNDENEQAMMAEIQRVRSGEITYAVRDTMIDDKTIEKGDYMGIGDKGILAVDKDLTETVKGMLAEMIDESSELVSVYYGCDVTEEDANAMADCIRTQFPGVDVELQMGGQPIYYYIMSVE